MDVELWIPGKPKTKDRPRFDRKRRQAYTPRATTEAEDLIANAYRENDGPVFAGPVMVQIHYSPDGQEIVISEMDGVKHTHRGDLDNLVKLTLDGLQKGGAFNDRSVVEIHATKWADED